MTIDHPGTPMPAPAPPPPPASAPALAPERRIGVTGIVFAVVAASAPLTVAAGGIPQSLGVTGILGIPLLYLLVGVVLALFSAGYAAMSRRITGAGAFYAYTAQGLGRTAGVGAAFVALLAYNAMQIGIAGLFGATTSQFIESKTGADIPWWALVLACTVVVGALGYRRVDLGVKVLAVLLVLEFGTVLVFDIGMFADAPQGISATPFTRAAATDGALGVALCCVFAAYMGFESAALYSEECRDPRRTVARATYIAVGLIGVFYAATAWAMISGAGTGQATKVAAEQGPEMLFFLSDRSSGLNSAFSDFAQLFLITSLLAALLSFHNAVARYVRSLGREGVLPRGLGALHPRHKSPHRGSLLQTALSVVVIGVFALAGRDPVMDVFTWLTNLGALGVILLLLATSASVIAYFVRHRELSEPLWNRLAAPLLSGVALAVFFWLALTNFSVQLGVSPGNPLRWILPCLILATGAAGVVWGLWLRRVRPETYAGIGTGAGQ